MKFQFQGKIASEGSKGGMVLNIPAKFCLPAQQWYRLTIPNYEPCFVFGRPRYHCTALLAVPPVWNFPGLRVGDVIDATVESAESWRAQPSTRTGFDWNAFVDSNENFVTEENDNLRLWSRYSEPFTLTRFPDEVSLYSMLGLYQAEGSKSEKGHDFTLANTNAALLKYFVDVLATLGIGRNQLYMEVLHGEGENPEDAAVKYAPVGLEITANRLRSGKGGNSGVIHARNSRPFKNMVCCVLNHVFANGFPSRETALAYALRWLDGDGSIIQTSSNTELRLAGLADEHNVMKTALISAFQWDLSSKNTDYQDNKNGTAITLRTSQMVDLLNANAFPFSMNRVRLLLGFNRRAANFVDNQRHSAHSRWGFVDSAGKLTTMGESILTAYEKYTPQIEMAKQLEATSPFLFGLKGVELPAQFNLEKT